MDFRAKWKGKMEKFRYITGILRPQKAKTPDFFCTKYGTFTLKIRHFQSKKSVLFRLPCQNLYPFRRSRRQKRPENGGKTLQNSSTKRHRKPQNILTKRKSVTLNSHRTEKRRKVPFAPQKGHFLQPRAANMPTWETFQATGSIPIHEKAPPPQSIQRK